MIPAPQAPEDIRTIVRQRNRWSPRQRVLALRAANKRITVLRMAGKIDPEEAASLRRSVLPVLRRLQQRLAKRETQKIEATPAARDAAEELGISLAAVTGTGAGGRIVKRDVVAHGT
jgi:pyruvate/2-oxoglutarate dehydrogenase complex dihydrolipoamide acyltransferase (E2) component